MDEQVDKEKDWKKSSKKNGQVSTELDLKGERSRGKSLKNRVHGEGRGTEGSDRDGGSGNFGSCWERNSKKGVSISKTSYDNKLRQALKDRPRSNRFGTQ